jgi:hypothetical protein
MTYSGWHCDLPSQCCTACVLNAASALHVIHSRSEANEVFRGQRLVSSFDASVRQSADRLGTAWRLSGLGHKVVGREPPQNGDRAHRKEDSPGLHRQPDAVHGYCVGPRRQGWRVRPGAPAISSALSRCLSIRIAGDESWLDAPSFKQS